MEMWGRSQGLVRFEEGGDLSRATQPTTPKQPLFPGELVPGILKSPRPRPYLEVGNPGYCFEKAEVMGILFRFQAYYCGVTHVVFAYTHLLGLDKY